MAVFFCKAEIPFFGQLLYINDQIIKACLFLWITSRTMFLARKCQKDFSTIDRVKLLPYLISLASLHHKYKFHAISHGHALTAEHVLFGNTLSQDETKMLRLCRNQ